MKRTLFLHAVPTLLLGVAPLASAQNVLFTRFGVEGSYFGWSTRGAGDVNADGRPDFVAGMPGANVGGYGRGGLTVFSGADGTVIVAHYGFVDDGFLGRSVAGVGDVNADGRADVIAGADNGSYGGYFQVGYVRVYSGLDHSVLHEIGGPPLTGSFGFSSAGVGDVSGDGVPDFIVGAPQALNAKGRAAVYSGSDASIVLDFPGPALSSQLGWSVDGAGDINLDGVPDLLVGIPFDSTAANTAGRAIVYSGKDGAVLWDLLGDSGQDWFGYSVAGAQDVSGDGVPDLIVGAPRNDSGGTNTGSAFVYSGATGSELFAWHGSDPYAECGTSVAAAGDTDGDSWRDLIVGAPGAGPGGSVTVYSGHTGNSIHAFSGPASLPGAEYGSSVSGVGDVNLDGFDNVIIGARGDNKYGSGAGKIEVAAANRHPLFAPPSPESTTLVAYAGYPIQFDVVAYAAEQPPVTLSVSGDPVPLASGVFQPALPATSQPVQTHYSWTPIAANAGKHLLRFRAADQQGKYTDLKLTLDVRIGSTLFVDDDAPAGCNGLSWATACSDLQSALALAGASPTVTRIFVARGTYRPDQGSQQREATFQLLSGVALLGGFAGTESEIYERDVAGNPTILSGDLLGNDSPGFVGNEENSYHVVTGTGAGPGAILDGFIVTGGNADGPGDRSGGGVLVTAGSPELRNCELRDNSAWYGGGMFAKSLGSMLVTDCLFQKNLATQDGGGLYVASEGIQVRRCTFDKNTAASNGGGVMSRLDVLPKTAGPCFEECLFQANLAGYNAGLSTGNTQEISISRCAFIDNSATSGPSALNVSTFVTARLTDCVIRGNYTPGSVGTISLGSGSLPTIEGCTFAFNQTGKNTAGINNKAYQNLSMRNCILYHNTSPTNVQISGPSDNIRYCCIDGWTSGMGGGPGNITANPLLADGGGGQVTLLASSPCIDSGDPSFAPSSGHELDLGGLSRILDGNLDRVARVDMGANEFGHVRLSMTGQMVPGATFSLSTTGTPGLATFLLVGFQSNATWLPCYGYLFFDLASTNWISAWPPAPGSVSIAMPTNFESPAPLVLQAAVLSTTAGNLSNPVVAAPDPAWPH